jgi:thiamine-phosphate pyrophosphorylase
MITSDAECLKKIEKYQPDYVVYRNKEDKEYAKNAKLFVNICREFQGLKVYLHRDYLLAYELGADGVHLTSTQFDDISLAKAKALKVIISTHTLDEVKKAQSLGVDAVTYSPIFYSPSKGNPKGVKDLQDVVNGVDVNVFALGGITTKKEIDELRKTDAYGFASIRYFN